MVGNHLEGHYGQTSVRSGVFVVLPCRRSTSDFDHCYPDQVGLIGSHKASNLPLKQELELEYIQKQSLVFDLQLFVKFVWAHIVSGGNVKARGKPDPALEDRTSSHEPH